MDGLLDVGADTEKSRISYAQHGFTRWVAVPVGLIISHELGNEERGNRALGCGKGVSSWLLLSRAISVDVFSCFDNALPLLL